MENWHWVEIQTEAFWSGETERCCPAVFLMFLQQKNGTQEVWPLSTNQSAPHESAPWITFTAKRRVMKFRTFCVQNPDCWLRIHLMRWLTSSSTRISLLAPLMVRRSGLVHTKINTAAIVFLGLGLCRCHHLTVIIALISRWFLWNYPGIILLIL